MNELDNIVREFLVESHENLDQLDRDLVSLEADPADRKRLASVFRTIHTIKGTCGFFGFSQLESVAHVGENLLSRLRDGVQPLTADVTTGLLKLVDAIREMLGNVEATGAEGTGDYSALVRLLTDLQSDGASPAAAPPPAAEAVPAPPPAPAATAPAAPVEVPPPPAAVARPEPPEPAAAPPASAHPEHASGSVSEANIRVDVSLLDRLMTLVGELVLARNQVLKFASTQRDVGFLGSSQRLNLITSELQEGVMKTRMQPIGSIWDRFPRVVRDLSALCGKQVRLEMIGKETELDRTIIEAIKDPLTHVVRNSIDHGVESPDARRAAGKPAQGVLTLKAYHEGGQVNIEIADDGGGIPPEKVKAKAVERGLITREQAARMSDRECVQLIFLPGFSTAAAVTNISGRGVGMDVVKTNIERIGGSVDVQSAHGVGTTLKIRIPLTLAIIPALIVTCAGDRYAIPQVNLLELLRLDGDAAAAVEHIQGAPVYRLRGRLLPLVHLDRQLGLPAPAVPPDAVNIVVVQADDRQFGLVVEGICDTEEIVVKPLCKQLKGLTAYAGATIMGDGQVALILDVAGLAQRAEVVAHNRLRGDAGPEPAASADTRQMLLLGLGDRRLAVPVEAVTRMEEIDAAEVEVADGTEVVQYRGQIMPLVRVADVLGVASFAAPDQPMQVVVYSQDGRCAGLVVDRILDIVEVPAACQRPAGRPGVLGSSVIQNKVTDLLDVAAVIYAADPRFFDTALGVSP